MKIKYNKFWVSLYVYRCLYSILGQIVIPGISILGDAKRYQTAKLPQNLSFLTDETKFTDAVGSIFSALSDENVFLINILFQSVGFIGIYVFFNSLDNKERKYALPLLLFPSFNLWSSIASKEAIFVFAAGIICAYISDFYKRRSKSKWYDFFALYLLILYKPHYAIAIAIIVATTKLSFKFVAKDRIWLATLIPLLSLIPLYIFRHKIVELSFQIEAHFAMGNSSRSSFWIEQYDVFSKSFEGMLIAFIGPTLNEVISQSNLLFTITFIESLAIIFYLIYIMLSRKLTKISLERYAIGISGLLWLMFVSYPTGVINPGSAIRYRTNYILFIILIFVVILKNSSFYESWKLQAKQLKSQLKTKQTNLSSRLPYD